MHDENKQDETNNSEYWEEDNFHRHDSEEGNHTRYGKWEYEKYERDDDSTEIEENHREVESSRDIDMSNSESSRGSEWFERMLAFEDDEEFRISKTHIDKECEEQIHRHDGGNRYKIPYSKKTQ